MSHPNVLLLVGQALMGLALGGAIGFVFFAMLRRNVALYVAQERFGFAVVLHVLRLALVTVAFALIVQLGAVVLLGAFASFLTLRTFMTRQTKDSS